jgi:hypothetical protein
MRWLFLLLMLAVPLESPAQGGATWPLDPLNFPRLKDFSAYRSSSNNLYVDSNDDCKHPIPGESVVLADLKGPGIVTHIWITVADNEYAWPRLLRFRVYYDGHKTPSVDAPLGDFFGVGHGYERNINSMMVRNGSFGRARNSYWPMPFRQSCKITITNEGKRRVTSLYYHVDWQKHATLPEDIGYFHAYYRQANPPPPGKLYTLLNIRGTGQYVGSILNIIQTELGWFGEGDDMFFVDDEKTPRIEGTGSEDYFNDAWALRVSDGPWTGIPVAEGEGFGARLTGYRWHVPDPVPFRKSLRVGIEHAGWTYNPDGTARSGFEEREDFFSSVAYWYQKGVNEGLPELPFGSARLPLGNALQIEAENNLKEVTTEKGEASVQKEVFWSKDLLFFTAQGPGSRINIPFDVPNDGNYEVIAQIAQAPDYGDYVATLDGKQTNSTMLTWGPLQAQAPPVEVIHNYQPEIFVGVDHRLGWFSLTRGRHVLTLTCVGKDPIASGHNIGVDGIVLEKLTVKSLEPAVKKAPLPATQEPEAPLPVHPPATGIVYRGRPLKDYQAQLRQARGAARAAAIRAIGAFGADGASATEQLGAALSDPEPEVRRAAARSLAEVGPAGSAAVPALIKALRDDDVSVRESAALALREMGRSAAAAIPGLCEVLKDPQATVRMEAASALGKIATSERPAVPALIEALQRPGEEVQTLRNISLALGAIGPAATRAIPALQQVTHLRVKYIAEEAIARIQGKPSATWH